MKEIDKVEFINLMIEMGEMIGVKVEKRKIDLYWKYLSDWKLSAIERGFKYTIQNKTYHILPLVGEIVNGIEKSKPLY